MPMWHMCVPITLTEDDAGAVLVIFISTVDEIFSGIAMDDMLRETLEDDGEMVPDVITMTVLLIETFEVERTAIVICDCVSDVEDSAGIVIIAVFMLLD